jgi:hypothetical protein
MHCIPQLAAHTCSHYWPHYISRTPLSLQLWQMAETPCIKPEVKLLAFYQANSIAKVKRGKLGYS